MSKNVAQALNPGNGVAPGKNLHFVGLGCSKNTVDSEVMLGKMGLDGYQLVDDPALAHVIILNTCSFIEAAKVESIEKILDMADHKLSGNCEVLVVAGCLGQRYWRELEESLPEVDLFIGTGEYHRVDWLVRAKREGKQEIPKSFVEVPRYIHSEWDPRIHTGPRHTSWLKVSEGCNRKCTFCIIPTLRGEMRSRSVQSLLNEAQSMVEAGAVEINLIGQDLSDYGQDLKSSKDNLYHLLHGLTEIEGLRWIRVFYYYPEDLEDRVLDLMGRSPKICSYLDMPIQHFSTPLLRRMNRRATTELIYNKIENLRNRVPGIVLRTSVIVGFPGETEEDFQQLLTGIEKVGFHHLGVFRYSDEEGTPAFKLGPKVSSEKIEERFKAVYDLQKKHQKKINRSYIGKCLDVLVEGAHPETDLLLVGRHSGQAPEIDGQVIINEGSAKIGEIVRVEVTEMHDYDLVGRIINS